MGMILGRRKAASATLAGALFAAVAVWAAPVAQAATCVPVPGSTIGTDVSIAGQKARVPAISGIQVCAGTATTPIVSVQTSGGTCTFACLSVLVGGDVDAEGLSISYREDGVLRTVPVNPPPVDGPASTCLFSVGSPDAPYPDCFIAIGPELGDPIGDIDPVIDGAVATATDLAGDAGATAFQLAAEAGETATGLAEEAEATASALAADAIATALNLYGYLLGIAESADETVCDEIPGVYDDSGYYRHPCDNAAAWANAMADAVVEAVPDLDDIPNVNDVLSDLPGCESVPDVYEPNGNPRRFCDGPGFWAGALVRSVNAYCDAGNCTAQAVRCTVLALAGDECA